MGIRNQQKIYKWVVTKCQLKNSFLTFMPCIFIFSLFGLFIYLVIIIVEKSGTQM